MRQKGQGVKRLCSRKGPLIHGPRAAAEPRVPVWTELGRKPPASSKDEPEGAHFSADGDLHSWGHPAPSLSSHPPGRQAVASHILLLGGHKSEVSP